MRPASDGGNLLGSLRSQKRFSARFLKERINISPPARHRYPAIDTRLLA